MPYKTIEFIVKMYHGNVLMERVGVGVPDPQGGTWVLPHEYFEIIRGKCCNFLYSGSSV